MVFVVVKKIYCVVSYRDRFEARLMARVSDKTEKPGLLGKLVLSPMNESEPYIIISKWETETAYRNWVLSDEYKGYKKSTDAELQAFIDRGEVPPIKGAFSAYELFFEKTVST